MKSLYPFRQVTSLPAIQSVSKAAKALLTLCLICFSFSASLAQALVFQNPKLVSGNAGADKAVYRFPNVKSGLDALVRIKGRSSNKVSLTNIDVTSSGHLHSFQPQVSYDGGTAPGLAKWYMDFEVTLVNAGTNVRTKVSEVDITALDIDGNGDKIREFVVFNDPINVIRETVSSLKIDELPVIDFDAEDGDPVTCGTCSKPSTLVLCSGCNGSGLISTLINGILKTNNCNACSGAGKVHSLCGHPYKRSNSGTGSGKAFTYTGPTTNYANIDTFATQVMVTGTWVDTDEVTVRIGGENLSTASQSAAERMYSLWFKEFRYLGAYILPVKLLDWKAAMAKNGVMLNWSTSQQINTSRFVIERSLDGKNFSEIGSVAAAGNSDIKTDYAYSDTKTAANAAIIYYRLKTLDLDGNYDYSAVKTVRVYATSNATASISAYPNPVVHAMNVVVPANWQGKKVTFEIFNVSGMLVKTVVNNNAGQVENMPVNTLSRGLYIVKATSGDQSATQRIVKSN